ncbi:CYTH domain-containing protein [Microbacterium sp. W1N]|uniref:CYTH domain-containing protein n=1 Tax=Microbacterium festucae TaxID=2977531 RepID=UPI0021BE0870|nr:CYTH domain-containing protein [Microbacterium festucae]MCT9819873.1 CYTH domain-containing protein [Microbacterium festucae]
MSAAVSLEVERKYDVGEDTPVPDWARLPGVATVGAAEPRALDARYFDTVDSRLAGALTALRRRTGGPDEGWHVKRSTPEGKLETHWPLGEALTDPDADPPVPDAIVAELAAVTDAPFAVIARIRNDRVAYALRGADGGVLAEFVDDHVHATDLRRGVETRWREWELELGPAAPADPAARAALFAAADALVVAAGGAPSASGSKLGRALGA